MADQNSRSAKATGSTKGKAKERGIRPIGPKKWEVRVHAGRDPITKKLRQVSRTVTGGIRDAQRVRAEMITEVNEANANRDTDAALVEAEATSFGHLLDEWLAHGKSRGRSPSTIEGYEKKIESMIRPGLGAEPVTDITAHTLDTFYGRLLGDGVSPATVLHCHRIISASLTQARKWGVVSTNVAQDATLPQVPKKPLIIPPPERVRALIELAAASNSPEWATVITLAALTGLRRGELCGLRWSDVDWQQETITVQRAIWQTKDGWGAKDPKTHQIRRLALGTDTMAVLAGRFKRATEAVALCEIPLHPEAYIFSPDIDGERPLLPGAVTQAFGRLCRTMAEKTGEPWPYRFHDLRHYTATELFRAGHHARTVADRLGHADAALTLRVYTHDTPDQARAAAESLEAGILTA